MHMQVLGFTFHPEDQTFHQETKFCVVSGMLWLELFECCTAFAHIDHGSFLFWTGHFCHTVTVGQRQIFHVQRG